jgi:bZIP-type transcription factor MBZ1
MSASGQHSSSTSPSGVVDPLDLLDFTDYDGMTYQSPAVSPPTNNKQQMARASSNITTPPTLPASQPMSGPSHQYDQYKQQTPFVPGALASTMAVNQSNTHINGGYNLYSMSPEDELFDFNAAPQQSSPNAPDMDLDFESPGDSSFLFPEQTINPSQTVQSPPVPSQTSNVGRMYPGMHQQAALAKAQQQRQQQMMQQQQRQTPQPKSQRSKVPMPSDPLVEQKITQLLNSMRAKPSSGEAGENGPLMHISRPKKEEDDMDEDERLLASEEGKKLSSKERRQLRNKVSARAFRSRRKGKSFVPTRTKSHYTILIRR